MPLFCGDYLKDTTKLKLEHHGAYLMILMITWAEGGQPLSDDPDEMATRLRITKERWLTKIRPVLAQFFDLSSGTWRNERLEREWNYVQGVIAKRRAAGAMGGRSSKNGPRNGPGNSHFSDESVHCNTEENGATNPRKDNETSKANGSDLLKQNGSTHPHTYTLHVEDSIPPVHSQKPSPAPIGAGGGVSEFKGKNFHLSAKTFAEYQRDYHAIPDLTAALRMLDEDLAGRKPDQVYGALRARLNGMHQNRLEKMREARAAKQPKQSNRVGIRNLGGRNAA